MKIHKSYIAVGMIVAFTLFFELAAHADEADQATKIAFSQPIQVPGQILPAGTYLFKLADPEDLNIVQILNQNGTHVYATLETIPTETRQVPGNIAVAGRGPGRPDILLRWFYPGDETGHEFVYSNRIKKQMAQDQQQNPVANQQPITDSEAAGTN